MLCLRTVQPLDPDLPGSVKDGLPLTVWVSGWTSHWLGIPILSAPFLSQHILQAGEIVDQKLCGWFGGLNPSMGSFAGLQIWF